MIFPMPPNVPTTGNPVVDLTNGLVMFGSFLSVLVIFAVSIRLWARFKNKDAQQ